MDINGSKREYYIFSAIIFRTMKYTFIFCSARSSQIRSAQHGWVWSWVLPSFKPMDLFFWGVLPGSPWVRYGIDGGLRVGILGGGCYDLPRGVMKWLTLVQAIRGGQDYVNWLQLLFFISFEDERQVTAAVDPSSKCYERYECSVLFH